MAERLRTFGLRVEKTALDVVHGALTGTIPWLEMPGAAAPIDAYGGEFDEIRRLGSDAERFYSKDVIDVRAKGDKAVVVVLSGGGALALGHLGTMWSLYKHGIPFHAAFGTSAGAIGAAVAQWARSRRALERAIELGKAVTWEPLRTQANFLRDGGLWRIDGLAEYIDTNIPHLADAFWEPIPALITVTDISKLPKRSLRVQWAPFPGTTLGKLVEASCSVPVWMTPTEAAGYRLCDGGVDPKAGFEPVDVARAIFPEALVISDRLGYPGKNAFYPDEEPDVRITPCQGVRDQLVDMMVFDPGDIERGIAACEQKIPEIEALLRARGIKKQYLRGFGRERLANLLHW